MTSDSEQDNPNGIQSNEIKTLYSEEDQPEAQFALTARPESSRFSVVPLSASSSLAEYKSLSDNIEHNIPLNERALGSNWPPDAGISSPQDEAVHEDSARIPSLTTGGEQGPLGGRYERIQLTEHNSPEDLEEEIDWDFWGAVMADYHQFASEHAEELSKAIEKGIPHTLRGMMWQLMSASKDPNLEAQYALHIKESSPHEKAIHRDLGRTFPHHEYFMDGSGVGQENLFNVLKAYSLHDAAVGYCQGLPFVAAILLLNMPDEEAFCLLVRLMQSYGLSGHFLPEMPGLQLRLFQFDRLVEELLPVLHIHFLRQGVKSSMYASQWFLTMFSYRFPLEIAFRVFDNCLATGIEAMFRFAIVLLVKNEDILLDLKFDDILAFLKNNLFDRYRIAAKDSTIGNRDLYNVNVFVQDAFKIQITPFMLDMYTNEWHELVRTRDAHTIEVNNLKITNRVLTGQVKQLEESLSKLNEDLSEVAKQLVLARVQNEELEGELVRYKLLYADAMHQSEAVLSSKHISSTISS